MDLHHLRHFVATAEELNFGRAARRLSLAQPALSRSIRRLEDHIGADLFIRDRRSVTLTPAGDLLLREARSILMHAQRALALAADAADAQASPRLRIGFVASALLGVGPGLADLERTLPDLAITMYEARPSLQIERLLRGELDVGLMPKLHQDQLPGGGALASCALSHGRLVVAMPRDNPLAARVAIDLSELANLPFILFPRGEGRFLYDAILIACEAEGFAPPLIHEAEQMLSALMLVRARRGVAIVADPGGAICVEDVALIPLRTRSKLFDHELSAVWAAPAATRPLRELLALLGHKD